MRNSENPVTGALIRHNGARQGIEVAFPARPDDAVLARLKAAGFRWSRASRCWYAKFSAQVEAAAYDACGLPRPSGVTLSLDSLADEYLGLHR